jgi:rhamnosyltransferase
MNNNTANGIYAIITTYNSDIACLSEQYNSVYPQVRHIVYVDNGSANIELLKSSFFENIDKRRCHIIYNAENMGLGHAQNQGIRYAKENRATHVLLLDHDSVLEYGFTQYLLKGEAALKTKGVQVGAVGPVFYNKKTKEIYPVTKFIGPVLKNINLKQNDIIEVSYLIASGCLIPVNVLNIAGTMDETFFVGGIDVEWSYRVQNYGFKIFMIPSAQMNHVVGDKRLSIGVRKISLHSPERCYYSYRNLIYIGQKKYIPIGYKIREITFGVVRIVIFFIISKKRFQYIKKCFQGIYDGIWNKA